MAQARKTGGRTSGTPNRKAQAVIGHLEVLGCDPIEGIAKIWMDETIEIGIRAQMYRELAQYGASKGKAIEVRSEAGQSFIDALRKANSWRDIPDYDAGTLVHDIFFTSREDWWRWSLTQADYGISQWR